MSVIDEFYKFFGLADDDDEDVRAKWQKRATKMRSNNVLFPNKKEPNSREILMDNIDGRAASANGDDDDQTDGLLNRKSSRMARNISVRQPSRRATRSGPTAPPPVKSVAVLTQDGLKYLARGGVPPRARNVTIHSRSFSSTRTEVPSFDGASTLNDSFFDTPMSTSNHAKYPVPIHLADAGPTPPPAFNMDETDSSMGWLRDKKKEKPIETKNHLIIRKPQSGIEPRSKKLGTDEVDFNPKRIATETLDFFADNTDRKVGVGFAGRLIGWGRKDNLDKEVQKQFDELEENDHRPFFTYWVTFVQIACYIIAICVYGIATIGISESRIEGEVLRSNLAVEKVFYEEKDNMWIGPRQADLIHMGAKYSPCMRKDASMEHALETDRRREAQTACCIRNDGSGCVQTSSLSCSSTLSQWNKYRGVGFENRTSGSVCGQDPEFCSEPASISPYIWHDNIADWPICTKHTEVSDKKHEHMTCEILGRPCCATIHAQCIITTREHCKFLRGYFHEEATLCSQVSCLNEVCGMMPFMIPSRPDQFYRLWTSLFIHAGILQLLLTILFQWFIMRDLEKLAGWVRIGIIYIFSGIAGSLGSAIFIPYHVEAGPSGSQFGLLACLFVEVIQNWQAIENPGWALGRLSLILLVLFIVGLLPMIDNYAHLFGFIFGFLLSFALMPYVWFNLKDRSAKLIGIVLCLAACAGCFMLFVVMFYLLPITECSWCKYFNCLPLTDKFCLSMEVNISRREVF